MRTYIRDEDRFLREALNRAHPGLRPVRQALGHGDTDGAWKALLAYFARRRKPRDPAIAAWSADMSAAAVRHAETAATDNLSAWRRNGRVNWTCGNRPRRGDWEKYWGRGGLAFLRSWSAAAEFSGSPGLRAAVARGFLEWYRDCPVPELPHEKYWVQETHGFAWREIEVAIRGRFLISLFLAAAQWPDMPPAFTRALLLSIRQHLDYLQTYYEELGFVEGNHQNHHAQPLLAAGILLPELKGAPAWRALGLRIYREHLASDFDADRVQNEYCPAYHGNMLTIYLDAYEVLKVNGARRPSWLEGAVRDMSLFELYATAPDGWQLPINDSRPRQSERLRRRAARLLQMPELLAPESGRRRPPLDRAYFPAGLAIMRSGWDANAVFVALDATKPNSGHWHPGKPNLYIQAGGQPLAAEHIFADYDHPSFWNYFHQGLAHNTVLVDGKGDGEPDLPWRWRHTLGSRPELTFFESDGKTAVARATTDGFRRLKPPVTFERTVIFVKPHLVFVRDVLQSRGEHDYEWLLHFLPGRIMPLPREHGVMTALGGAAELCCRPLGGADLLPKGPLLRTGWTRNATEGCPCSGRKYWLPPPPGKRPALLAKAPYAAWKLTGKCVNFDFALQILRPGDEPIGLEALRATLARLTTGVPEPGHGPARDPADAPNSSPRMRPGSSEDDSQAKA